MMLSTFKIGQRLALAFGVVLALLAIMAAASAWQANNLASNTDVYADDLVPSFQAQHQIAMDLGNIRRYEYRHVLVDTLAEKDEIEPKIREFQKSVDSKIDQYLRNLVSNEEDRRTAEGVRTAFAAYAATWEKVVAKLNANAMPPVGSPRPSEDARQAFVSWLEHELDRAAAARPFVGPTSPFHRLNRTEYQNTIRDLFGLEIDAAAYLPGDDAAYGFDNNAEVLSMSPTLFDGYLAAASRISQLAVGDVTMAPVLTSFQRIVTRDPDWSEAWATESPPTCRSG
mgnify:CR=1 FL=1